MRAPLFLLPFVALASPAVAQNVETPKDMVPCRLKGWSNDQDPAGLNVRAGPAASAAVVGRLKQRPGDLQGPAPEFEIAGFKGGWFLIKGAHYGDYGDPPAKIAPYSGLGWVHGSKIGGELLGAGETLRTAPDANAASLPDPNPGSAFQVRALLACQGGWVKVDTAAGAGWANGLCANQVTTCN